jgi:Protein of unknown function (DUF1706)
MSERWFPKDKEELMLVIDRERASLWNLMGALSDKQAAMTDPVGWSAKDHMAHVFEWMRYLMVSVFDGHPWHLELGVDKKVMDDLDFDTENAILFKRDHSKSQREIMTEFEKTCAELYSRLNAISFEDMQKPRFPDDPEKRPLMNWILGNTTEHFVEHREYIEKLVNVNNA